MLEALIKGPTQPPGPGSEGPYYVEPSPGFIQHTVAGSHGEKEEAGQSRELLQTPVAPTPAETPSATAAIIPYDQSGCYQ
jgi:hypothetical protein